MNKMLVSIFDNQMAADAGLHALRKLHAEGNVTLYVVGVLVKDAKGVVSVRKCLDPGSIGAGTGAGLAVGSLIGLLGGPVGVVVGAVTGAVAGAVRDFWVAGVGLDFIEETEKFLQPGKVALVAEIEEEWVNPVDSAIEAAGGRVFRRTRTEVAEAQFDHDISAFRSEIIELEAEASYASGAAKTKLQSTLAAAKGKLDNLLRNAKQRVDELKEEAEAKVDVLRAQLSQSKGEAEAKIEARVKHVKSVYHARGVKLSQAWALTREALAL